MALRFGDEGNFTYKGWDVSWSISMTGYVTWEASSKNGALGDDEGGEFGGGTRSGIAWQIKDWINRFEKGDMSVPGARRYGNTGMVGGNMMLNKLGLR